MKISRTLQGAVLAAMAAAVVGSFAPTAASASDSGAIASYEPGTVSTYDGGKGVRVCDTSLDGMDVYSDCYVHNNNTKRRVATTGGKGSCAYSDTYSSGINKFNFCLNKPLQPDICSSYWRA